MNSATAKHRPPPRIPYFLLASVSAVAMLPWFGIDLVHHLRARSYVAMAEASEAKPEAPKAEAKVPQAPPAFEHEEQPADARVLAEVARRNAELDRREKELQAREARVEATEKLARQQVTELTQIRDQVEKLVGHESTAAGGDMDLLVGLFTNMKPAQAAVVIGKLDPPKAALILEHIDTRMAGPILAAMDPSSALGITEEIEQRRATFQH